VWSPISLPPPASVSHLNLLGLQRRCKTEKRGVACLPRNESQISVTIVIGAPPYGLGNPAPPST
jgi:hypothetical protein